VTAEAAPLTATELRAAMDRARRAAHALRSRSVDDLVATLDRVIANWTRPRYPLRRRAEQELPAVTGFSDEMIRHGLLSLLAPLRAEALGALLDSELGDRRVLDQLRDGRRAFGPPLIAHVLSGNIPGLAATPILLSLALKSAVLVKSAAGDPLFPVLFAESIREVDEALGQCVVVANWRGGDRGLEDVAFADADLVVASGSDAAITAIAARVPSRFIGYGHKISFAVIGKERLPDADAAQILAVRLAYDASLWDQQGCLSPQLCYVESGGAIAPARFAELLADGLAQYARKLSPRRLSFEEQAQVLRFRQEAEWRHNGAATLLASDGSTDWSISIEADATFLPSCLNRCVRLKVIESLSELPPALAPHRCHLEAAGLAIASERVEAVTEMLACAGVHRICPIGTMQRPPLAWRQSGRPRIADWVEWTVVEEREA
jgi:hypothetical protein